MADLTLERIAELRTHMELLDQDVFECGSEFAMVTLDSRKLKQLLDAAERGLTSDRKAAAFDRLSAMRRVEICNEGHCGVFVQRTNYDSGHGVGRTLLEAIEQLPEVKHESK